MAATKVIKLLVLMNNRNRIMNNRAPITVNDGNCEVTAKKDGLYGSYSVVCVKVRCTFEQFIAGAAHEMAITQGKKFIHKRGKSSEDFDLLCFDRHEGHFINPAVWKMRHWKKSEVTDISKDKASKTNQED
jgi:hypothetical protein